MSVVLDMGDDIVLQEYGGITPRSITSSKLFWLMALKPAVCGRNFTHYCCISRGNVTNLTSSVYEDVQGIKAVYPRHAMRWIAAPFSSGFGIHDSGCRPIKLTLNCVRP